jgi:hypothetical protein
MEDAELQTTESTEDASLSASGFSFDPRTQKLLDYLDNKSARLSDMLKGAWIGLAQDEENPDKHAQVAHSVRELMEKAQKDLTTLPMQLNSGPLVGQIRNLSASWKVAAIPITDTSWDGSITAKQKKMLVSIDTLLVDFDTKYPPTSEKRSALIQALDGSSAQIPQQIMTERDNVWKELSDYFIALAHHNTTTSTDDLRDKLIKVEQLLLDIMTPEVIPVLDDIDALIENVETTT